MTTAIEYALMAGASYISTRDEINQFPAPDGWFGTRHDNLPSSGYEAISFVRTGTTKGVSFAFFLEQPCHVAQTLN